jgi:Zn-dependent metalloprotease/glucose/arabinose dehydrogenase
MSQEARGRAMIARFASDFGVTGAAQHLALISGKQTDQRQVTRFRQLHEGIPVMAGELIVNAAPGGLLSINGEIAPDLEVEVVPTIAAEAARQTAVQALAKWLDVSPESFEATEPELWIYDPRLLKPDGLPAALVWRIDVTAPALGGPLRELVLVDAQRGSIRLHFNQIDTQWSPNAGNASSAPIQLQRAQPRQAGIPALTPLSVSTYDMEGSSVEANLPGPTLLCTQATLDCTGGADVDADEAHHYAIQTHDYYLTQHGRDSLDNAGLQIISSVNFDTGYQNAFWNGQQLVYGDGMTSDDVVGHELTHGVTQFESNLLYWYQSGAINESFSDVWGELYDQQNGSGSDAPGDRWQIAEDSAIGIIRSMSNPPAYGDPDRMTSVNYDEGNLDSGGVHSNSGVNNKAAYLMVDGATFNGRTITALGAEKTLAVYYETQTDLLTSGADYLDLYNALYQACLNIAGGPQGVTGGDCEEVREATEAVEMNLQPAAGFNTDAPFCASGDISETAFYDDLESGAGNWEFDNGPYTRWQYDMPPEYGVYAHSGLHYLYADDWPGETTDATATLAPVPIPANAVLHFSHAYAFEFSGAKYYDGGVLEYSSNGGPWTDAGSLIDVNGYDQTIWEPSSANPLAGVLAFAGESHGYISTRVKLNSLAGQNVSFRWRMGLDQAVYNLGWWLDDVRIYHCGTPTSTPTSTATNTAVPPTATNTATSTATNTAVPPTPTNAATSTPLAALDPARLHFQPLTSGLSGPVLITHAGDGSGRIFIVEQAGRIRIFKNGALLATPFLDIQSLVSSGSERGLLALAFHPEYETNGLLYVMYTNVGGDLALSRFQVSAGNPDIANATGSILHTIPHPSQANHNGGTLAFGPDGYLYWSTGDGGGGGDPYENGQNLNSLLGKILRLDVDSASPYAVPAANPFVETPVDDPATRGEIWSYGLRNPWRMAFDRGTGDLYIGDVGQGAWEEIDFQSAGSAGGENYGWDMYEANAQYNPPFEGPYDPTGKVFPVASYSHSLGCSVTGGHVYRGADFPSMLGHYFYGDYCSGRIFSLYGDPQAGWTSTQLIDTTYGISTFGENEAGELFLADYFTGTIYRLTYDEYPLQVAFGGVMQASYFIGAGRAFKVSYPGVQDGPVEVVSTSGRPILTSERGFFGPYGTFNEVMGIPDNQLTNHYWFPWYDNVDMITWILVGNPDPVLPAHVTIKIAGDVVGEYDIAPGDNTTPVFDGVQDGPVEVISDIPVFTSERTLFGYPFGAQSFNEVAGYPHNQLTNHYWFPWYDNADMITWILVGNPSSSATAHVTIKIAGATVGTYDIPPNSRVTPQFNSVQDGPVEVISDINVFTSQRALFGDPAHWTFNEVMGYPHNQLTNHYWFPWYDNAVMITWVLVGNPSSSTTAHVTIKIAGATVGTYDIPPNSRVTPTYGGVPDGPVEVTSDINVFTSQRVLRGYPAPGASFNEYMGMPDTQLTSKYWFTWYDSRDMSTDIVIAAP